MIRISVKKRTLYFLLIFFYRLSLDWIYRIALTAMFSDQGYFWRPSAFLIGASWLLLLVTAGWMWRVYLNLNGKISYEILFILYLLSFIPFTTMLCGGRFTTSFWLANSLYWILLICFCTREWRLNLVNLFAPLKRLKRIHFFVAIVLLVTVVYISGKYAGFRLNFNLSKVYDLRAEAKEYPLPTLLKYLFSWSRIVNSILIAYFIRSRRYEWAIFCGVMQLFSFGIDGSKTTFFLMLFAFLISLLPAFEWGQFNTLILSGILALDVLSSLWYVLRNDIMFLSMFARRMRFLPVRISSYYFDFFTTHQPDFFRQSFLRHFGFHSPYIRIPYMIAWEYDEKVSSYNNGLISDGVANLGWAGVVIFPLFVALILKLLDKCAKDLDIRIVVLVALYVAIFLSNSFSLTVLLTHGLLLIMFLLSQIERNRLTTAENRTDFWREGYRRGRLKRVKWKWGALSINGRNLNASAIAKESQ